MLVALRAAEILSIFTATGLPVCVLLLPSEARVLFAPVTGLAILAIFSSFVLALGWPVFDTPLPFAFLVFVLWIGVVLQCAPRFRPRLPDWRAAAVLAGLLVVLAPYLWPAIRDPGVVFWHYAGSDGYMYMRLAEQVG